MVVPDQVAGKNQPLAGSGEKIAAPLPSALVPIDTKYSTLHGSVLVAAVSGHFELIDAGQNGSVTAQIARAGFIDMVMAELDIREVLFPLARLARRALPFLDLLLRGINQRSPP